MNNKRICRLTGIFNAGCFSFLSYLSYIGLSQYHSNYLYDGQSIEEKIIGTAGLGILSTVAASINAFGITDGLVDAYKGTHHYFGLKIWQKLSTNSKTKKEIQSDLEKQLEY